MVNACDASGSPHVWSSRGAWPAEPPDLQPVVEGSYAGWLGAPLAAAHRHHQTARLRIADREADTVVKPERLCAICAGAAAGHASVIEDSRQWDAQRLAARCQQLPARRCQRHDAAGGEVQVATLAALAGDQQLIDARKPLALRDLVELCIHPLQELLPGQERLDVEGPQEVP